MKNGYYDLVSEKYLNTDAKDYSGSYEEFIFTYTGKETIVEKKSNVFNHILHPNELRIYTETFKIPNEKTQS